MVIVILSTFLHIFYFHFSIWETFHGLRVTFLVTYIHCTSKYTRSSWNYLQCYQTYHILKMDWNLTRVFNVFFNYLKSFKRNRNCKNIISKGFQSGYLTHFLLHMAHGPFYCRFGIPNLASNTCFTFGQCSLIMIVMFYQQSAKDRTHS